MAVEGAFPALTTLQRVNSPFPSVAFQNPGCSAAARVEPKGKAGTFMSYHCFKSMALSGMSIQILMISVFVSLAFSRPMEKSVAPVG